MSSKVIWMLCVGVRISTAPLYVWKGEPTLSVGEILARDYYWDLIVYRVILGQTYLDKMQMDVQYKWSLLDVEVKWLYCVFILKHWMLNHKEPVSGSFQTNPKTH